MDSCKKFYNYGMIIRVFFTIISFFILYSLMKNGNKFCNKYFLIILAVLLLIIDYIDILPGVYYYNYNPESTEAKCHYSLFVESKLKNYKQGIKNYDTLYYNIVDKCFDTLSYILAYFVFRLNNIFLYFLLYRMIGIGIYIYTLNSRWLVLFFDFMKEYLVYFFLAKNNLSYMWFFVLLKIIFEKYLHYY
jgi:hypothetical protein